MEEEVDRSTNTYETIIIFNPHYDGKTTLKENIDIFKDMCQEFTNESKKKIKMDELGEKKLAYEINGQPTGYYVVFTWMGNSENVSEIERCMRINDHILKFITVKQDDDITTLEDLPEEDGLTESEQMETIDAMDVLLGLAQYKRKEVI